LDKYEELARRYGVSVGAVETLALALRASGGKLAQFNHPDLGGMGQWMPGMIMIGDMFNNALKAKVDALCTELAQLITSSNSGLGSVTWPNYQAPRVWWPERLGTPASSGGRND
jgi:hypothetical protein